MVSATRRAAASRRKSMCASTPAALAACIAALALASAYRAPASARSRCGSLAAQAASTLVRREAGADGTAASSSRIGEGVPRPMMGPSALAAVARAVPSSRGTRRVPSATDHPAR
eukprot:1964925-Pleurochrysis_carterae.AAC.1